MMKYSHTLDATNAPQTGMEVIPTVRPGDVIAGKFRIEHIVGTGGMGFVVMATHLQLEERVALKFLQPEAMKRDEVVARFSQEARATAKIKSEHVARVFDVGQLPNGTPFIVMEYLEGIDLARLLTEQGPLPWEEAVDYTVQACEGLAEAHARGIIHRDIKPDNLFLVRQPGGAKIIKILDFGISKLALTGSLFPPDASLAQAGLLLHRHPTAVQTVALMGTPLYMPPEQIRSTRHVDHRSDIWSLGAVLYELVTGVTPFQADSIHELCNVVLEQPPRPLELFRPGLPGPLKSIILRCLEKDPDRRYANVAELAIALLPFAPRHSHTSAQKSTSMLREAGISDINLKVPSMAPPSLGTHAATHTESVLPSIRDFKQSPRVSVLWGILAAACLAVACIVFFVARRQQSTYSEPTPTGASSQVDVRSIAPMPPQQSATMGGNTSESSSSGSSNSHLPLPPVSSLPEASKVVIASPRHLLAATSRASSTNSASSITPTNVKAPPALDIRMTR